MHPTIQVYFRKTFSDSALCAHSVKKWSAPEEGKHANSTIDVKTKCQVDGWMQRLSPTLFVVLWSTGPVATKVGVADVKALDLLAWRFGLLAAIMGSFGLVSGRLRRLPYWHVAHCAVAGILIQAIYLGTAFVALDRGMMAGLSALITGLQPVAAAVCAAALLNERLSWAQIAGMGMALLGLLIYAVYQLAVENLSVLPLTLHLFGVISIGVGLVYQRRFCRGVRLVDNLIVQYVAGAIIVTALFVLSPTGSGEWTTRAVCALLWLVVVLSLGAITLLVALTNRGYVTDTANLFFLMPPTTAVMASLYLGEELAWPTMIGLLVATTGVALATRFSLAAR